ncbi:Salicylate carboxymethyltransferase, partial [Bienertia sinuspersici]
MDMLQVFHMNKGQGESSYAKNCTVQDKILSLTKSYVEEAIQGYFMNDIPETMVIADLGCSSGPTALDAVWGIIDVIISKYRKMNGKSHSTPPKFMVFLNDLPGNDFNEVFGSLSNFQKILKEEIGDDFGPCFVAGLPGSFYGRLLPSNSLHFVHSSSSLHWLSQVPPGLDGKDNPKMKNKGKIYLSKSSSSEVINAYKLQFQNDFMSFLKSRGEEVISGGRMVFTLMGRRSYDTYSSEGVEEEKVDSFNVPYYAPCPEEIKELVEEEESFREYSIEAVEVEWDGGNNDLSNNDDSSSSSSPSSPPSSSSSCKALTRGERIAKMHRAVSESMLEHCFGGEIMDGLYHRYSK